MGKMGARQERRMIPKLFVPRAGRMEPSMDERGCGGSRFGRTGSWYWMCSICPCPLGVQTDMDECRSGHYPAGGFSLGDVPDGAVR